MHQIEDYFLIGDLQTAALVSKGGSIDWLCLPYFDSSSLFARILDPDAGSFSIRMPDSTCATAYIPETALVQHTFQHANAQFTVKDFMVPKPTSTCKTQLLIRKIEGQSGSTSVVFQFHPMLDYGKEAIDVSIDGSRLMFSGSGGRYILFLPSGTAISSNAQGFTLRVPIAAGETKQLKLEHVKKGELSTVPRGDFEQETHDFWKAWVAKGHFYAFCRDRLIRSAITLKLMQFYPTGGIIAAPTTSLPEAIGGVRNWDYRYVWVRDATFILYGLSVLGYTDEAMQFFSFIENVTEFDRESERDIHLMYSIHGELVPKEQHLSHMAGYKNSQPVRIGNGATNQFQLDTYGALIDAYYFISKFGMAFTAENKEMIRYLLTRIEHLWDDPDNGIWEVRGGKQHFVYSKIMCWVGVERALQMKQSLGLDDEEIRRYEKLERTIYDWIWDNCYDADRHLLKQHPNTDHQDATNFLFVLLHFLDKDDPRTTHIIETTARELVHKDIFVYRYFSEDGLSGGEGAFILCTFWYITALARIGEGEKALELFQSFESCMNDHYLIAEEIDEDTHEYLGNFPQAFSHLGYIISAGAINRYQQKQQP